MALAIQQDSHGVAGTSGEVDGPGGVDVAVRIRRKVTANIGDIARLQAVGVRGGGEDESASDIDCLVESQRTDATARYKEVR